MNIFDTIEYFRTLLVNMQSTELLGRETDNKKRLDDFYKSVEAAKEALDAILQGWDEEIDEDEYWGASNEADESLIAHINRRV